MFAECRYIKQEGPGRLIICEYALLQALGKAPGYCSTAFTAWIAFTPVLIVSYFDVKTCYSVSD